jgi:drug/metabolite transporter (DMT)-like permease
MPIRYLAGLFVLGAIWGASFMLIKVSVAEVLPAAIVAIRLIIASAILLVALRLRGLSLPRDRKSWQDFTLMGTLGVVVPFTLITWGQQFIPSNLTGILNAVVPILSALLAYVWAGEERLGGFRLLGVGVGFAGVVAAIGLDGLDSSSAATLGELAVLGAALCYAVSGSYARRAFQGMPPLVPAAGQLTAGAIVMTAATPLLGGFPTALPSPIVVAAIVALGVLSTAAAYILFYWLIDHLGATRTAMVTYLIAPFGLLYGAVFLAEPVTTGAILGLGLVITGILITNGVIRLNRARAAQEV